MIVLSEGQIQLMTLVMDDILKWQSGGVTVEEIKKKYSLTNEEYNMIFDLCMPNMRAHSWENTMKQADGALKEEIRKVIRMKTITDSEKIRIIKGMCDYSNQPKKAQSNEYDLEEEAV